MAHTHTHTHPATPPVVSVIQKHIICCSQECSCSEAEKQQFMLHVHDCLCMNVTSDRARNTSAGEQFTELKRPYGCEQNISQKFKKAGQNTFLFCQKCQNCVENCNTNVRLQRMTADTQALLVNYLIKKVYVCMEKMSVKCVNLF